MTRVNLAYRHANGEVEGFSGWAFTGATLADADAVKRVREKCESAGIPFAPSRILRTPAGLSAAELATVRSVYNGRAVAGEVWPDGNGVYMSVPTGEGKRRAEMRVSWGLLLEVLNDGRQSPITVTPDKPYATPIG